MNSALDTDVQIRREEYSGIAKFLHWSVAVSVLAVIPLGVVMDKLPEGIIMNSAYNIHKSLGLLILLLMLPRLAYRVIAGAPAHEPTISAAQRIASTAVHHLLYMLLIAQGALGVYANSVYGATTPFFGLFALPVFTPKNEPFAEQLFAVHELIGFAIAGLLILHIGGALYHYFIRRDGVMQRMLP